MYRINRTLPLLTMAFIAALALTGLFVGCEDNEDDFRGVQFDPNEEPPPDEVFIQGYAYNPETLRVAAGTKVTWENRSGFTHTVTSGTPGNPQPGPLRSGQIPRGLSYRYTFTQAGTYPYFCNVHVDSNTTGVVIVD